MSFIGNEERENKEKQLRRHATYSRSNDPIENLSRVEDAMTMVNSMKEESGFVLKRGAVNRVVDPSYGQHHKLAYSHDNDMIFHPEDLQNQLADDYFSTQSNDMQYIKSLSYKEKKTLLRELEKIEQQTSTRHQSTKSVNRSSGDRDRSTKYHRKSRKTRSPSSSSSSSVVDSRRSRRSKKKSSRRSRKYSSSPSK